MDPVTVLGLVAYFLLAIGLVLSRLETACDAPACAEVHRQHRTREAADKRERQLADAHRMGWHDKSPYQGCPLCIGDL